MTRGTRDEKTVAGFGREWATFDQSGVDLPTLERLFEGYFAVFPWAELPPHAVGADIGTGSGRWARFAAPRVGHLICLDPSREALAVARRQLDGLDCSFLEAEAGALPLRDGSLDFAYSLGVLHHTKDPARALADCAMKLKTGAPLLVYLYYAFDNRPWWFRALWRGSDVIRRVLSRTPFRIRYLTSQLIALAVYWPLARIAATAEHLGFDADSLPLSFYRNRPLYVMRNDALDRFGTRIERRFLAREIIEMMEAAGLREIEVDPTPPYWCVVGRRA